MNTFISTGDASGQINELLTSLNEVDKKLSNATNKVIQDYYHVQQDELRSLSTELYKMDDVISATENSSRYIQTKRQQLLQVELSY